MASGDIYQVRANFSTNNRGWSTNFHVEEVTPSSEPDNAQIVSDAISAHFMGTFVAVVTTESFFESVEVWKRWTNFAMPGKTVSIGGQGTVTGNSLPNDNALVLQLRQSAGAARFNGKLFFAGQSVSNHDDNVWDPAYLGLNVELLALRFLDPINAVSPASGVWRSVVLSKKFVPPATAEGTALDVTSVVATTRVMTQRRRQQKADGYLTP